MVKFFPDLLHQHCLLILLRLPELLQYNDVLPLPPTRKWGWSSLSRMGEETTRIATIDLFGSKLLKPTAETFKSATDCTLVC